MAYTALTDLIIPSVFTPYMQLLSTEMSALFSSGIVVQDAEINRLARGDGATFNMPFYNDLTNTESRIGDDSATAATPDKITAGQDIAVKHIRNMSWGTPDLAQALVSPDPMDAIARLVAGYWNRQQQRTLIASLTGVFADNVANDSNDMVVTIGTDATGAPSAGEKLSGDSVITAAQTMGDHQHDLVAIAMHSVPYSNLRKNNLITFIPDSVNDPAARIPTFLNMRVILDDGLPAVAGTNRIMYSSYLFARGAVGYGEGVPKTPTETERQAAEGNGEGRETLHSRRHFILHPRGVKFTNSSVASTSPTNAELGAAANWDRVWDRKLVKIVEVKSNG